MSVLIHICMIAGVILFSTVILGGVGLAVMGGVGRRVGGAREILAAPWIGWCALIVGLQFWHFWYPVDWRPIPVIVGIGILGLARGRRDLFRVVRRQWPGVGMFGLLLSMVVIWLAYHATKQLAFGDSALYHVNTVQWTATYPIVPGLGNLHARFAFNNSYFLYVALLDTGTFAHRSHHLANSLLAFIALARILAGWWRLLSSRTRVKVCYVYDALFLVPTVVLSHAAYGFGSSPAPDFAIYTFGFFVSSEVLWLLEKSAGRLTAAASVEDRQTLSALRSSLFTVVFVSAVCVAVKLSFIVVGLLASCVAFAALVHATKKPWPFDVRTFVCIAVSVPAVILPWMARGVYMSGYPAFPSTLLAFPVAWRLPVEQMEYWEGLLTGWARLPTREWRSTIGNVTWLWPWINQVVRMPFEFVTPLVIGCVLSPAILFLRRSAGGRSRAVAWPWLFMLLPFGGLLFWFVKAPMPRYAGALFWMFAFGALALSLRHLARRQTAAVVLAVVVVLFFQNVSVIEFLLTWGLDTRPAWTGNTKVMTTNSGLEVHVPVENNLCFDAPLPCTPHFDPYLRLRVPGDMSKGFVSDKPYDPGWKIRD